MGRLDGLPRAEAVGTASDFKQAFRIQEIALSVIMPEFYISAPPILHVFDRMTSA
jgi:hypothetical protein